jgi:hypothetical protein
MSQRKYDLEERLLQVAVEIIHIVDAFLWPVSGRLKSADETHPLSDSP